MPDPDSSNDTQKNSTRERLLDVAEELFAKNGVDQTSLREITSRAEANLAAVHYHFGSKEGLLRAIVQRCGVPLHQKRLALLEEARVNAGEHPPHPRALLRAFIQPVFELRLQHPHFPELMARVVAENLLPVLGEVFQENFVGGLHRFAEAFSQSLPGINEEEIRWRLLFTVGAFHFVCKGANPMSMVFGAEPNQELLLERLLGFCEAGIVATTPTVTAAGSGAAEVAPTPELTTDTDPSQAAPRNRRPS